MTATVRAATAAIVLFALSGCGGSEGFEGRRAVTGNVTIDGSPLPKALIVFIPQGQTAGPKVSGVIENGTYTIAEEDGPLPGEFLVKIETITPEIEALAAKDYQALHQAAGGPRPALVAPEYNRDSQLKATVKAEGENRFDFDVKSAPEPKRRR